MMTMMLILIITTYIQYISDKDCAEYQKTSSVASLQQFYQRRTFVILILYYRTKVGSEKLIDLFKIIQLEKIGTRFQTSLV